MQGLRQLPNQKACQSEPEIRLLCGASSTFRARPSSFLQLTSSWACRSFSIHNQQPSQLDRILPQSFFFLGRRLFCCVAITLGYRRPFTLRLPRNEFRIYYSVDKQLRLSYDLTLLILTSRSLARHRTLYSVTSTIQKTSFPRIHY